MPGDERPDAPKPEESGPPHGNFDAAAPEKSNAEQQIYKTLDREREASERRQQKVANWSPYDEVKPEPAPEEVVPQ